MSKKRSSRAAYFASVCSFVLVIGCAPSDVGDGGQPETPAHDAGTSPAPDAGQTPTPDAGPTPGQDAGQVTPPDAGPVPPSEAPVITSFLVDGEAAVVLNAAGPVTLSWSVQDASSCAISPTVGSVNASGGSVEASVSAPTNFTLACSNGVGTRSATVSVAFELPAEILHFTVDGAAAVEVLSGSAVTLSWDTTNALSCEVAPGVGSVGTVGTRDVVVTASGPLTLTCQGPLGAVSESVDVDVYYPPAITSFSSDTSSMRAFVDDASLTWSVEHADTCSLSPGIGDVNATAGEVSVAANEVNVTLTYTLTCTGRGGSDTATVSIDVPEVVHTGDFVLTAQNGSQLVGVNRITGTLSMQALFLSTAPFFDTLQHIEGELFVKNMPGLTTLSMPRLQTVGSHLTVIGSGALATLALPSLTDVGGYVTIDQLKALTTLTLSALDHVGGNFYVSHTALAAGVAQTIANGATVDGDVLVYRNVLTEILSDIVQPFLCEVPSHWPASNWRYQFQVHAGGAAYMFAPNATTGAFSTYETGTWTRSGDNLSITIPSKGTLSATALSTEMDAIISFTMNAKLCGTMGLGGGTGISPPPTYQCPNTNWESGLYIDDDSFELFADSSVRWVRETDTLGTYSDTFWTTRIGTYFQLGNRLYFAFPTLGANPWLTATKTSTGLVFDNLGAYSNTCTKQ